MDTAWLQTIVAVKAAGGNQTVAAKALGVDPSRVSQRLSDMQTKYGDVFVPGSNYNRLTPIGRVLLQCADAIGPHILEAEKQLSERKSPKAVSATLRVGYSRSHVGLVASALAGIIKPNSGLKLFTFEQTPKEIIDHLRKKKIDVGVTYPPEKKPIWLQDAKLKSEPLALVVNKGHKRYSGRSSISPADLRNESLALLEKGTYIRIAIDKYFGTLRPRKVVLEADAATTLLALAREGLPTILPGFRQDPANAAFEIIPLSQPPMKVTAVLWRGDREESQAAVAFREAIVDAADFT